MRQRQIINNALMAISQVIVFGAVLFFLYRYLLTTLGVEKLGIWSLVLASTSAARVANLGLSGSVVKFVAKYAAYDDYQAVSKVIQTTVITVGLLVGVILLIAYPLALEILSLLLKLSDVPQAVLILPYALFSTWLAIIFQVYSGGLDGLHRIDIRSIIMMVGTLLHAGLAIVLVERMDLIGLALSQVIQYFFLLTATFFSLRRSVAIPILPYQWDRKIFQEMLTYGVNFQVISVTTMLYDPLSKGLLTKFGGLAMVGYFDMANRLVLQVRGLITTANQVLVPTIAELKERSEHDIENVYKISVQMVLFFMIPIFTIMINIAPEISEIWIGYYEPTFITSVIWLSLAQAVNTASAPAYFAYLGIGKLCWNTAKHILVLALNIVLGFTLGEMFGGIGVIIGLALALVFSSIFLVTIYIVDQESNWNVFLNRPNFMLALSAIFCIIFKSFSLQNSPFLDSLNYRFILIISFSLLGMIIPFWFHPVRYQLQRATSTYFLRTQH